MFDSLIIRRQPQKMTIFKRGVVRILFVRSFMPLLFFSGMGASLINDGHFMAFGVRGKETKNFEGNKKKEFCAPMEFVVLCVKANRCSDDH